jgi:GT2 family glycosyltransferase
LANQAVRATVIIVTYQHANTIDACLQAVTQTIGDRDEIIVVDNGSTDGTVDQVVTQYPGIQLLRPASNLGFGGANNVAAALARGDYLCFLNPDTKPCVGWLDSLIEGLSQNPEAGIATAKLVLEKDPSTVDAFGNTVHISGITTCNGWGEASSAFDHSAEVSAASGACLFIKRSLFHRLGGFDERLFLYYEDTDLSLRVRLAGYRCLAVPSAVVQHDHTPGFEPNKLRYLERNRWWTLLKLLHFRTLVKLVPVLILAETIVWGFAVRSGPRHMWAKLRAWCEVLAWLRHLPGARMAAGRFRTQGDRQLLRLHGSTLVLAQAATGMHRRLGEVIIAHLFVGARSFLR